MMGNTFYWQWEVTLMEWLQGFASPILVKIASIITLCGEEMVMVAIMGFLYWCYDKNLAKRVGVNLTTGVVWNPLVKNIFLRRRPYFDNPTIECLKPVNNEGDIMDITTQGYSFPSGHSANAAVVYGSIAYLAGRDNADKGSASRKRWLTIVCILMPVLVGISRFFLGVHYPTDVFVGWLLGTVIVFLVSFLQKKITRKPILYLILALVSLPGMFYCTSNDYFTGFGMMVGMFAGFMFEEKYVNFSGTKNVLRCVIRLAGGFALFLGLNSVLKLPFSKELLESASAAQFAIRTIRYAIVVFVVIGLYPMLFKYTSRFFEKTK